MNFGKLRFSEFVIFAICLTLVLIFIIMYSTQLDIEKEKTEQLKIQQYIQNNNI